MNTQNVEKKTDGALTTPCRHRRRKLLVLLLAFVLGMLLGGALAVGIGVHCLQYAVKHPDKMPARIAKRLSRKLDLSDQQREEVEAVLVDGQSSLMAVRVEVNPRVKAELDRIGEEISDVLTEQQRREWRPFYEKLRKKWAPALPETDD